jgi:hypothetical protein
MWGYNPLLDKWLAQEHMKDTMRDAEQARLIGAAKGPRKSGAWRLPVSLILSSLLALFMPPQSC